MPALDNHRWERVAQHLAKGESQIDAYVNSGYRYSTGAAARLCANVSIQARAAELLDRAAMRVELTRADVLSRLAEIADKGHAMNTAPGLQVARAAMMDAAKLNGWIVDRHAGPTGGAIPFTFDLSGASSEELDVMERFLARKAAEARPANDVAA